MLYIWPASGRSVSGSLVPINMSVMPVIWKDMYALKKYGANSTTESLTSHNVSTRFKNPWEQAKTNILMKNPGNSEPHTSNTYSTHLIWTCCYHDWRLVQFILMPQLQIKIAVISRTWKSFSIPTPYQNEYLLYQCLPKLCETFVSPILACWRLPCLLFNLLQSLVGWLPIDRPLLPSQNIA